MPENIESPIIIVIPVIAKRIEINPINENCEILPINPYGRTKAYVERILQNLGQSDREWKIAILRYFNPVGAHPSSLIGEDPVGSYTNLFPFICQVCLGNLSNLNIYGNDYLTRDGTCIRDYIHISDISEAHRLALEALLKGHKGDTYNVGSGVGYSVLQVIDEVSRQLNLDINVKISPRRMGDPITLIQIRRKSEKA